MLDQPIKLSENIIGVNPEDYRECKRCKLPKEISKFRKMPNGSRSPTCFTCQANKAKENRELELTDDGRRAWIIAELIKQYRATDKNTDKIRCLEALAKLQPDDKKTPLDDPSVIQSLMRGMADKKKREMKVEDAGTNEPAKSE